jgi:cyclophilin family peptidyl-prolyl cis-trans isomerase
VFITAVNALRKLDSAAAVNTLIRILKTDTDYRVRISAVRALASFNSLKASQAVIESLNDSNANVGIAASETLKALPELETQILEKSKATKNWRIQSNLYKLALELGKAGIEEEIIRLYKKSTNDYQKAALLNAASVSMAMFDFIANELKNNSVLVVKTTGAQALVNLNQKFSKERQQDFAVTYQEAILQGDPGVIGIVTSALKNPELKFKELIKDYSFLLVAKSKLSLPKDVEALQPLEEAIAYFEGKEKPNFPTNPFNHPIDWKLVKSIPANQQVKIKTDKGDVILKLWVEEAPGSVANFVELVNKKYFNNKNFHRVVPNFVIQGGCNRGDGFGSEDYSIRSEFNLRRYTEGSVGMASAGKDTEGTQWFITHSPTPHLDGRYTIFATVSKGMEVVHAMEVGDKIIDVSLIK